MGNKRELVSQAEFARRVGVDRSQVSRAIKRGRIEYARGTKLIDYKKAKSLWEENRTDNLAGTGRANNTVKHRPLPPVRDVPDVEDVENIDDIDDEDDRNAQTSNDEIGKPPKRNTIAYQNYREKKAKADRQEMKAEIERGNLLPKPDIIGFMSSVLGGLKSGIVSLPNRTALDVWGIVKGFLIERGLEIEEGDAAELQSRIQNKMVEESHAILTDIGKRRKELESEVEKIAKKYRK